MVKVTFYGGVNEIGGNKILVEYGDTKIFLDFGMSFSQAGKYYSEFLQPRTCNGLGDLITLGIIPDIQGIYRNDLLANEGRPLTEKPIVDAVFLSHAHADHSWHVSLLHPDIPMHCGFTCKLMLQAAQETSRGTYYEDFYFYRECFKDRFKKPEQVRNFKTFRTGDKIKVKDIEVEPIHVDHCLSPDTFIQLSSGEIKKVSEIDDKEQILSFDLNSNKIISSNSEKSSLKANSLLRIITPLNEIKVTPEHRFICLNDFEFTEKKAKELKVGEHVIYFNHIPSTGKFQVIPKVEIRQLAEVSAEGLEIIRNKRKKLKLTQKDVGKKIPVNHKFYGVFETGKHRCNLSILTKLLDLLNINKKQFLKKYVQLEPDIKMPTEMSLKLCQLLGYILGDGSWDHNAGYVSVIDKDEKNLEIYGRLVEDVFGFKPRIKPKKKDGNLKELSLPSFIAKLILSIDSNFFVRSPQRRVPYIVHKVTLSKLAAFLRGLYDAEGSVGHHSIVLTSTSKDLIEVVKLLLLRFGIISWTDEANLPLTNNLGYQLVITHPPSIKKFKTKISFGSPTKRNKLNFMIKRVGNTAAEKIDLIPICGVIKKILEDVQLSVHLLQKSGLNVAHFTKGKHIPSRSFLRRFLNLLRQYSEELKLEHRRELAEKVNLYINKLEKIISSPLVFLPIKSIEELSNNGEMWTVYDVYVPKCNNLIANGFLVHNSIPGAYGFLVHTSSGTIAYSGDIRFHGPKKEMTEDFIEAAKQAKPIALILEGTNIDNRLSSLTEEQVYRIIQKTVSRTKNLVMMDFPIRDIDRLRTFFKVSQEAGRRLVINMKQAYLLELLKKEDKKLELPSIEEFDIFLNRTAWGRYEERDYMKWQRKYLKYGNVVKAEDMIKNQSKYMLYLEFFDLNELVDIKPSLGSIFIHSLTEPFNEEMEIDFNRMMNWLNRFKIPIKHAHASGHADSKQLKKIAEEIKPKMLFPIHTEKPEMFKMLIRKVKIVKPEVGKGIEIK
ncbi:MAG: LAGLIDADG family homing endonuclease [Candidatus Bathyarchaeia archaeon]